MRAVIADDHFLVRQSLMRLMQSAYPGWDFAEAGTLDQALDAIEDAATDLLVIDLGMPGMDGGASLKAVRETYPALRVAVLTGSDGRDTILECLGAGVHGYILKSGAADDLLRAVGQILAGGMYVPPLLADSVRPPSTAMAFQRMQKVAQPVLPASAGPFGLPPDAGPSGTLTPRQKNVLSLLAEGRSTKDIARTLNLGVGTVKVHLAGVYRALGAQNRMEAVVKAGRITAQGQSQAF